MPAAEAVGGNEKDLMAYELAFHVLPTVAEGEVSAVLTASKRLSQRPVVRLLQKRRQLDLTLRTKS